MNAQVRQPQSRQDQFSEDQFREPVRTPAANDASIGTLLKNLAHEVPSLLSKEVELAKNEARETLHETERAAASMALGGTVAAGGFIILLLSAVYGLSTILEPWLAALIVGGVALVIGYAMLQAGKSKLESTSLRPEHTLDSLRQDREVLKGRKP